MKLGNIADGADFYDRKQECADIWRYLQDNHLIITGPRRLGKSSVLNRLREEASEKTLLAKHVDVEGIDTAEGFIEELNLAFPDDSISHYLQNLGENAISWLPKIKKIEIPTVGSVELQVGNTKVQTWLNSASALQARLSAVPVLIFIDEFSVFLEKLLYKNSDEALALLAWLRKWRVTQGVACRFVFTGSIGLNALLETHRMTTEFNDCFEYLLPPFSLTTAQTMLKEFAEREQWHIEVATTRHLCDKVGWLSPYYLCLLLDKTFLSARDRLTETGTNERALTPIDVDNAYENLLSSRSVFIHWRNRLERDLAQADFNFCKLLLAALSNKPEGLTLNQLSSRLSRLEPDPDQRSACLQRILCKLREEGYLTPINIDKRTTFLSFLLRDWWSRNHG